MRFFRQTLLGLGPVGLVLFTTPIGAAQPGRFLGPESCSSSSCHGGAADNQNQHIVWSTRDYHSRSAATLGSRRSAVIAEQLKIPNAANDARCTVCHAPFRHLDNRWRGAELDPAAGVSCETCHFPAENWIRSHTRRDLGHAARVADGLRDLQNPYVRANTCVACHQNIDRTLLAAGHPELIFELDGQTVTQPRHWREPAGWSGARAWLVGQSVALREMTWQFTREPDPRQEPRWLALNWLLRQAAAEADPQSVLATADPTRQEKKEVQEASDRLALRVADLTWSNSLTEKLLKRLTGTATQFRDPQIPQPVQGRRAELIVLGLDRLFASLGEKPFGPTVDAQMDRLTALVQSLPDFDPGLFAGELSKLAELLDAKPQT